MRPFLTGFADEIVKLAAFPQQHESAAAYDAGIGAVMDQSQGAKAKTGLKTGLPIQPPAVAPKRAPTPLTTPNHMVDYLSRGGGGA